MYHKMTQKNIAHKTATLLFLLALLSGLFGCAQSDRHTADTIVSFYTSDYGTEKDPVYAFALDKDHETWYFSADCRVSNGHYISFSSFPIPAEDAEEFLALLCEEGEVERFRRYRKPLLARFLHISDAPRRVSGMTFDDGDSIEKETAIGERALDFLYSLADKQHQTVESAAIHAVSLYRNSMDHSFSYSFTLEKDGKDWFFSFDAVVDSSGTHTEVEKQRIEEDAAKEILRIVKEQQLVSMVRQYKKPPDDGIIALDETTYQTSFRFAGGSWTEAPIDAGEEVIGAFYSLAAAVIHQS